MTQVRERQLPLEDRRKPIEPGGFLWNDGGLITFSLSAGASFGLQTMHPTVGAVVGEHSTFATDAFGRAQRSLWSVMTWVYGGHEALAEGDRLRAMHAPLNTTDAQGVRHTALASGPWAWIILTAPYAFAVANKYFSRRRASRADVEQMYGEIVQLMRNLHVAEKEIPPTYDAYLARFDEILDGTLVAHPTTYLFLETTRRPPPPPKLPKVLRPLWRVALYLPGRLQHFVVVGTLPPRARTKLGLTWTDADERRLRRIGRVVGWIMAVLPERLKYFPVAAQARRVHRAEQRLQRRLARRPT